MFLFIFSFNLGQNVKKLNFYKSKHVSKATAWHTFCKETSKSKILGNNLTLDNLQSSISFLFWIALLSNLTKSDPYRIGVLRHVFYAALVLSITNMTNMWSVSSENGIFHTCVSN